MKKKKLIVILLMVLMLPLTCCRSYQKTEENETANNDFYFPAFPNPVSTDGKPYITYDETTDNVVMPYEYWLKICEYALNTEAAVQALTQ